MKLNRKERRAKTEARVKYEIHYILDDLFKIKHNQELLQSFVQGNYDSLDDIHHKLLNRLAERGARVPREQTFYMKAIREANPIFFGYIADKATFWLGILENSEASTSS